MRFFEKTEMDIVAARVFMTRQGVYYRINTALKEIAYIVSNTV
jgi:hypothetical protein